MTQPVVPIATWSSYPAAPAHLTWVDATGTNNWLVFDLVVSEEWEEDATVTEHPVEIGADVADHVRVELRKCTLEAHATNEPIDSNNFDQATLTASTLNLPAPDWAPGPGQVTLPVWDNPIELRSLAGSLVGLAGGLIGGAAGGSQTGMIAGDIAALVGLEAALLLDPATAIPTTVQTDAGLEPPTAGTQGVQTQQWPGGAQGTDYVQMTIALLQQLKDTAQQITLIGTKTSCFPMVIEKLTHVRGEEQGTGASITLGLKEVRTVTTQVVAVPIPNLSAGGGNPPQPKGKQDTVDAPPQVQVSAAKQIANLISKAGPGGIASLLGL